MALALLAQMARAVLDRALGADPDDHPGYVKCVRAIQWLQALDSYLGGPEAHVNGGCHTAWEAATLNPAH